VQFTDLRDCNGRITRQIYLLTGLVVFGVKHYFDCALASRYGISWHIWNYWEPLTGSTALGILTTAHLEFFVVLLLSALPFIWIGVTLTEKRLRDAGQPMWLTVLFLAPVVNLLVFTILCVLPSRNPNATFAHSTNDTPSSYWPQGRLGSTALGAIVAGGLGIVVTWFDLRYWGIYGLTLFIALPFVMGYFAAWVHCRQHHRSFTDILAFCTLSVLIAGIGILAIAIKGAVCLFMAAPIAWILSCLGGLLAYKIHNNPAAHHIHNLCGLAPRAPRAVGCRAPRSAARPSVPGSHHHGHHCAGRYCLETLDHFSSDHGHQRMAVSLRNRLPYRGATQWRGTQC
jgi:uncharacterized membrane protein YhaH (DUF805 family)